MGSPEHTTQHTTCRFRLRSLPLWPSPWPAPRPTLLSPPTPTSPPSTPTSSLSRTTTPTTTSVQRRRETAMAPRGLTTSACPMVVFRRFPTLSTEMVDMSSDVTYEGEAQYPPVKAYVPAPAAYKPAK